MITHYATLNTDTGVFYAQAIEQRKKSWTLRHLWENNPKKARECVNFLRHMHNYDHVVKNIIHNHSVEQKAHIYKACDNLFDHNPNAQEMIKVSYNHKDAIARNMVTNWLLLNDTLKRWVKINPDQDNEQKAAEHNILFILLAGAKHLIQQQEQQP
jgi:hypothetical protein